jgi:hypothetical protein
MNSGGSSGSWKSSSLKAAEKPYLINAPWYHNWHWYIGYTSGLSRSLKIRPINNTG